MTEYEKGQIDILNTNGKSLREIERAIGREWEECGQKLFAK